MAATKTTSKKTTKVKATLSATPSKTTTASKTTGAKKKKTTKKSSVAKATTKKTTTKSTKKTAPKATQKATKHRLKKTKSSGKNNAVTTFLSNVVKQANKTQKTAQAQTKVWIKKLNAQDKQLSQLTKKITKARPKTRASLDKKITKLQTEMSATRSGLLAAENAADKVSTFIEWTTQLNSKPSSMAYLQTSAQTPSRPTLVKSTSSKSNKTANFEEEYPEEIEEEDLNFVFGEDEDIDEELGR